MHFQWYVVNLDEGEVKGSNNVEEIEPFIDNDQYVILSGQHGVYFLGSRVEKDVTALVEEEDTPDSDEDGDDD